MYVFRFLLAVEDLPASGQPPFHYKVIDRETPGHITFQALVVREVAIIKHWPGAKKIEKLEVPIPDIPRNEGYRRPAISLNPGRLVLLNFLVPEEDSTPHQTPEVAPSVCASETLGFVRVIGMFRGEDNIHTCWPSALHIEELSFAT